jgi:hypothetical protein
MMVCSGSNDNCKRRWCTHASPHKLVGAKADGNPDYPCMLMMYCMGPGKRIKVGCVKVKP